MKCLAVSISPLSFSFSFPSFPLGSLPAFSLGSTGSRSLRSPP